MEEETPVNNDKERSKERHERMKEELEKEEKAFAEVLPQLLKLIPRKDLSNSGRQPCWVVPGLSPTYEY